MTDKFHAEAQGIIEAHTPARYEWEDWLYMCGGNSPIDVGGGILYMPVLGQVQKIKASAKAQTVNAINDELAALKLKQE